MADDPNRLASWWNGLWNPKEKPDEVTPEQMSRAEAFVDPSRLFPTGLITAYNPDELVQRKGMRTYDTMKRDEQVKSCLSFKKYAILSAGFEIVSPADQAEDWEVTDFVRDSFDRLPGGFRSALRKMLLKLDYGYSITEKVYGDAEWAEGKKVLTRLISVKPHFIDFEESPHGELLGVIQRVVQVGVPFQVMPPAKFIVFTHDKEFENHYGRADLQAAYRPWWIKDNAYKWFAIYLERYGMAPLFALYDPNVYQGVQLNALKSIVNRLQAATSGVIPRANEESLELWSQQMSTDSRGIFLSAISRFDADIAKAMLVPALIGMGGGDTGEKGGEASKGSYARSQTHFDSFMLTVGAEQGLLADDAINGQLIPQMCDLNFPGLKSYPVFRFLPLEDDKRLDLYKTWIELVNGKVVTPIPDDETHIREVFGMPENDNPGEAIEEAKKDAEAARSALGAKAEALAAGEDPEEVPEEEQSFEMRQFAQENEGVWVRFGDDASPVCVKRYAWDESKHPRGKTSGKSTPGSFSPREGASVESDEELKLVGAALEEWVNIHREEAREAGNAGVSDSDIEDMEMEADAASDLLKSIEKTRKYPSQKAHLDVLGRALGHWSQSHGDVREGEVTPTEYRRVKATAADADKLLKRLNFSEAGVIMMAWDESKHPRHQRGTPEGGQFTSKDNDLITDALDNWIEMHQDEREEDYEPEEWNALQDELDQAQKMIDAFQRGGKLPTDEASKRLQWAALEEYHSQLRFGWKVADDRREVANLSGKMKAVSRLMDRLDKSPKEGSGEVEKFELEDPELPGAQHTQEMLDFAQKNDCVWRVIDGRPVCIRQTLPEYGSEGEYKDRLARLEKAELNPGMKWISNKSIAKKFDVAEAEKIVDAIEEHSNDTDITKAQRRWMDKAYDKAGVVLDRDVVLWRGLDLPDSVKESIVKGLNGKKSAIISQHKKKFVPTSSSRFDATEFGDDLLKIVALKGTKVLPIGKMNGYGEREVTLDRGAKFRIFKIEDTEDGNVFHAELISSVHQPASKIKKFEDEETGADPAWTGKVRPEHFSGDVNYVLVDNEVIWRGERYVEEFAWDEARHPRHPAGSSQGGEFASIEEMKGMLRQLYEAAANATGPAYDHWLGKIQDLERQITERSSQQSKEPSYIGSNLPWMKTKDGRFTVYKYSSGVRGSAAVKGNKYSVWDSQAKAEQKPVFSFETLKHVNSFIEHRLTGKETSPWFGGGKPEAQKVEMVKHPSYSDYWGGPKPTGMFGGMRPEK